MWHQFKALAARIGLTAEDVAAVERKGEPALVEDPRNPEVQYKVGPDPDWTRRIGEAWNQTLANSRRETAGTLLVDGGELEISNAEAFAQGVTASVVAGQYEVTFTVAHLGAEETHDYEEYVSHAFVVLQGNRGVTAIEPLTDAHGVELGVVASQIAFAKPGVLQQIAGDHAGRWTLRKSDLFFPETSEAVAVDRKSVRVADDGSGTAILLRAGHGREDYPLFRLADADGNTVGVLLDFFVDNRSW